jgi:hypothetical protein
VIPTQADRRSEAPANRARRIAKKLRSGVYDTWRLPSGARLADFALASGFLAPPLMYDQRHNDHGRKSDL